MAAIFRAAPSASPLLNVSLFGERSGMPIRFFFWRDVLAELRRASTIEPDSASICVLTGSYGLAKDGPFMEIEGFEGFLSFDPETTAESTLFDHVHARFLDEISSMGSAGGNAPGSGSGPLGFFYHSPGSRAALDEMIVRLHLSLCNIPYQLILMADLLGDSRALALYTRRTQAPFINTSFYVLSQRAAHEEGARGEEE